MNTVIIFVILAIIQGLTEPLPVSSSGHLVIFKQFFDIVSDNAVLEIMLHVGSLFAIILFYYQEINQLVINNLAFIFKGKKEFSKDFDFALKLVIATIPAGIIGLLFKDAITLTLNDVKWVGWFYLITTALLLLPKLIKPSIKPISYKNSLIIGCAQALALLPGVSRSGSTIATSMALGINPEDGMKFSFFMFIPIAIIVIASGTFDLIASNPNLELLMAYGVAIIVSFLVTYYAMRWLSLIIRKDKYHYFALYTLILSLVILFFL
jgi:undecaprenyl-diphosphatase